MHIIVKSKEANLNLPIPNFVFANKVAFKIFMSQHKDLVEISAVQEEKLYHILKKGIKMYRGLVLVEVESAEGEYVKITL